MEKRFIAYFHFVGWDCFSLGGHVCFGEPNIEVHLPFGFIRIGWQSIWPGETLRWKIGRTTGWTW